MIDRTPPTLDMRLDGSFSTAPRTGVPLSFKLMVGSVLVAAVAGSLAMAAFALWIFSLLLPVIVIAGLFGWATLLVRRWQSARGRTVRIL